MELGQIGYEAYAQSTGGQTYDGRPMPTWADVKERTPHVAKAWEDAAGEIAANTEEAYEIVLARRVLRSIDGTKGAFKGGLGFGEALFALRTGHRVARAGWNGKKMWIALTPGSTILPEMARAGAAEHYASQMESEEAAGTGSIEMIRISAHLDMKAADGTLVIGWLASQTDMLAEDWMVVE